MCTKKSKDNGGIAHPIWSIDKEVCKKLDYKDTYNDIIILFIEKIQKLKCQELRTTDDYTLLKYIKRLYNQFHVIYSTKMSANQRYIILN